MPDKDATGGALSSEDLLSVVDPDDPNFILSDSGVIKKRKDPDTGFFRRMWYNHGYWATNLYWLEVYANGQGQKTCMHGPVCIACAHTLVSLALPSCQGCRGLVDTWRSFGGPNREESRLPALTDPRMKLMVDDPREYAFKRFRHIYRRESPFSPDAPQSYIAEWQWWVHEVARRNFYLRPSGRTELRSVLDYFVPRRNRLWTLQMSLLVLVIGGIVSQPDVYIDYMTPHGFFQKTKASRKHLPK